MIGEVRYSVHILASSELRNSDRDLIRRQAATGWGNPPPKYDTAPLPCETVRYVGSPLSHGNLVWRSTARMMTITADGITLVKCSLSLRKTDIYLLYIITYIYIIDENSLEVREDFLDTIDTFRNNYFVHRYLLEYFMVQIDDAVIDGDGVEVSHRKCVFGHLFCRSGRGPIQFQDNRPKLPKC